jgi:cytochrome o ubiquinol oxidase subunit 2
MRQLSHHPTPCARRLVVAAILTLGVAALSACSIVTSPVGNPAGPIALDERELLLWAFAIMTIVALPVFALTAWFAFQYRASNTAARYQPEWSSSKSIEMVVWLVPALMVIAIGSLVWASTHALDPYRPLVADTAPLKVQAIAQDWRWLFIYPDLGIATVNELAIPAGRPVVIDVTSDTVMNALFIPRLAGQIYAMAGMRTRLNLKASRTGRYTGRNSQYSGAGFADQRFSVLSLDATNFGGWVAKVKSVGSSLDIAAYDRLTGRRAVSPVIYFSDIAAGLFDHVIGRHAARPSDASRASDSAAGRTDGRLANKPREG